MGRGKRAQRRTGKKKQPGAQARRRGPLGQLRVTLERMELSRAHDGFLRGGVEPRLLLGAFLMRDGQPTLLGRSITSVGTLKATPQQTAVGLQSLSLGLPTRNEPGAVTLLCLVLEEDSGRDIETLFADLATPARFVTYEAHTAVPEPIPLTSMMARSTTLPPHAEAIQLLRDGRALEDVLSGDDWIGAAIIRLEAAQVCASSRWNIEARSHDQRNDWTLWLHIDVAA